METFPLALPPSSLTLRSEQPTLVSVSHSLRRQVRSRGAQRFAFEVEWSDLTTDEANLLRAFVLARRGRFEPFLFVPPSAVGGRAIYLPHNAAVRYTGQNLFQLSNDLANSYWAKTGVTAPANRITENTATSSHKLSKGALTVTAGAPYCLSAIASDPGGTQRYLAMEFGSGTPFTTACSALFDLRAGTVLLTRGGATARITLVSGSDHLCELVGVPVADGTTTAYLGLSDSPGAYFPSYTGDGVSGTQITSVQLEVGSHAGTHVITTTTAAPGTAPSGRAVTLCGLAAGQTNATAGEFIQFAGHAKGYLLTADLTADTYGNATASIEPALYATPPAGDLARLHPDVQFQVAFDADEQSFGYTPPHFVRYACTLVEVL